MAKKIDSKNTNAPEATSRKSTRKKLLIVVPIIIILLIIVFVWFSLSSPETVRAQLIIDSGTVQVKHEGGSWTTAENGLLLAQSDSVKTGDDTVAAIILFESSI